MATATMELTKEQKKLLKNIEKGIKASDSSTVEVNDSEDLNELYAAGLIHGEAVPDNPGKVRVSLAESNPAAEPESGEPEVIWQIDTGSDFPMKPASRGGKKGEQYPFSKLKLNDSFLIPATDKHPKPWESFASTVTSASRRFSTKSTTEFVTNRKGEKVAKRNYERKFTLRRVTKGDTYSNGKVEPATGVRIYRIQ